MSARLLSQEGLQIFASLLYLRVLISIHQGASEIHRAKYINVCWKAFDKILLPDFLLAEREQLNIIQDELFKELPECFSLFFPQRSMYFFEKLLKKNAIKPITDATISVATGSIANKRKLIAIKISASTIKIIRLSINLRKPFISTKFLANIAVFLLV